MAFCAAFTMIIGEWAYILLNQFINYIVTNRVTVLRRMCIDCIRVSTVNNGKLAHVIYCE